MRHLTSLLSPLERQVRLVYMTWGSIAVDARNDAPWKQLRGGKELAEELDRLYAMLPERHLTDDEMDALWDDDEEGGEDDASETENLPDMRRQDDAGPQVPEVTASMDDARQERR